MPAYRGIIQSNDAKTVALFQDLGEQLEMCMTIKTKMPNFLLDLQEDGYQVAIVDFGRIERESLKWVKLIRRIRPKVPLIVICDQTDLKIEAGMYEEKIFYLGQRPFDKDRLFTVFNSALKTALCSQFNSFRKR